MQGLGGQDASTRLYMFGLCKSGYMFRAENPSSKVRSRILTSLLVGGATLRWISILPLQSPVHQAHGLSGTKVINNGVAR